MLLNPGSLVQPMLILQELAETMDLPDLLRQSVKLLRPHHDWTCEDRYLFVVAVLAINGQELQDLSQLLHSRWFVQSLQFDRYRFNRQHSLELQDKLVLDRQS
jgi:hypothetical protein